ncbi:MAG TPA: hypothetical protein VN700_11170 [Vicinamibacterales bacterium]|nr:hypothetical protein [Vicinamibacterales bacterium]
MKRYLSVIFLAALASTACFKITTSPSPINSTSQLLGGTWVTVESIPGATLNESCTNFKWQVTEYTGQTATGTFSARCYGQVDIAGSAQGTLSGVNVNWSANATATLPGNPTSCAISLSGVATLETDKIRIPYSGTTCMGPVSGTEVVRR